jgi:hypothetical protein
LPPGVCARRVFQQQCSAPANSLCLCCEVADGAWAALAGVQATCAWLREHHTRRTRARMRPHAHACTRTRVCVLLALEVVCDAEEAAVALRCRACHAHIDRQQSGWQEPACDALPDSGRGCTRPPTAPAATTASLTPHMQLTPRERTWLPGLRMSMPRLVSTQWNRMACVISSVPAGAAVRASARQQCQRGS